MKPRYEHDCDYCVFLGSGSVPKNPAPALPVPGDAPGHGPIVYDFYVCPRENPGTGTCCLARWGSEGPNYASMTCYQQKWDDALAAHDAGKARPSLYHPWVPELLECWRRARTHTFHPNENGVPAGPLEKQGKVIVDASELQRLRDLVRHQRGPLHDEGLITDEEYAALAEDHVAVARLEGYDEVRAKQARARSLLDEVRTRVEVWLNDSRDREVRPSAAEILRELHTLMKEKGL